MDAAVETISTMSGPGPARMRADALGALFARTSEGERDFLRRLLYGELRQGALEAMLAWQTTHLQTLEIARDAYTVFVRPELVAEVAFNDVQDSPVYPGGVALRFARVKRYRTDKTAGDADTIETVRALAGHPA